MLGAGAVLTALSVVVAGVVPAQARPILSDPASGPDVYANLPGELSSTVTSSSADPLRPFLTSQNQSLRVVGNFFLQLQQQWHACQNGSTHTLLGPLFGGDTATGTEKIRLNGLTPNKPYRLQMVAPPASQETRDCQFQVAMPAGKWRLPVPGGPTLEVNIPRHSLLTISPQVRPGLVQISGPGLSQAMAVNGSTSNPFVATGSHLDVSLTAKSSWLGCISPSVLVAALIIVVFAAFGAAVGAFIGLATGPGDPAVLAAGLLAGLDVGTKIGAALGLGGGLATFIHCLLHPPASQVTPALVVAVPQVAQAATSPARTAIPANRPARRPTASWAHHLLTATAPPAPTAGVRQPVSANHYRGHLR